MSTRIVESLKVIKKIITTVIIMPFVPLIIQFLNQTGKNVGFFLKNLYFFVVN